MPLSIWSLCCYVYFLKIYYPFALPFLSSAWWDWPLTQLTNHCLSVLWHLTRKIVPKMTYNTVPYYLCFYIFHYLLLENVVVYFQAVDCYKKSLQLLSSKQGDGVVDTLNMSVSWDLSSVYFTMATYLQDFAPVSSYAQQQVLSLFKLELFMFLPGQSGR